MINQAKKRSALMLIFSIILLLITYSFAPVRFDFSNLQNLHLTIYSPEHIRQIDEHSSSYIPLELSDEDTVKIAELLESISFRRYLPYFTVKSEHHYSDHGIYHISVNYDDVAKNHRNLWFVDFIIYERPYSGYIHMDINMSKTHSWYARGAQSEDCAEIIALLDPYIANSSN